MTHSKTLLDSIRRLRECFASTTAALAPYPVTAIEVKKKKNEKTKKSDSKNL